MTMIKKIFIVSIFLAAFASVCSAAEIKRTICPGGGCDYTSLEACMHANEQNLTDGDGDYFLAEIQEGTGWTSADTTPVSIDGWTASAVNYIHIYATGAARHNGVWDDTKYRLVVNDASAMSCTEYAKIEGLQIKLTGTTNSRVALTGGVAYPFSENIIKNESTGTGLIAINGTNWVKNNIIYDFNTANSKGFYDNWSSGTMHYWYNNTVYNCTYGFYIGGSDTYKDFYFKNNIAADDGVASTTNFAGAFFQYAYNNASSDDTANKYLVQSGNRINQTFSFKDEAGDDFHLTADDPGAKNYGLDLSSDLYLPFSDDIDGETRSGSWDIGADEWVEEEEGLPQILKIQGAELKIQGSELKINK